MILFSAHLSSSEPTNFQKRRVGEKMQAHDVLDLALENYLS